MGMSEVPTPNHSWVLHSVAYSDWAREYYEQQCAKGKRRNTAVRSLAFKWIRVLFRCWKTRTPYDEGVYRCALKTAPPTVDSAPVELQWKKVAGFRKIATADA